MKSEIYTSLQMREVFHLEFLRSFSRKMSANQYALKGGVNLRFFFQSTRYSEDMDIDIQNVGVEKIKKLSMDILASRGFVNTLRLFGIKDIVPPNISKAKQTDTTQRFKVHLATAAGQDLFTKIEFSRRESKGRAVVESIPPAILRFYKMPPLVVSHYDAASAAQQKIGALAHRTVLQARDIFDLFLLSSQVDVSKCGGLKVGKAEVSTALNNLFQAEFSLFRDSVVAYLGAEDQKTYASASAWDEIKLKVSHFLEEFGDA